MNKGRLSEATPASSGEEARHQRTQPRRQSAYVVDAENFRRRVLQDALAEGLAATFDRRAALFEWARPRPTDFRGSATPAEVAERDARLRADADRCRRHADLLLQTHADAYADEVRQVLREVA
ncbi:hypothetical protein E1218_13050 [Kribbella turkmenica]|uniref:Uncharacterized protein n=1 Tax=Kribbella turkmenica TaxID=2530375 RepID=A0A4V2YGC7_9ACTN|nr:hypothetical protein [Kribbella turkmenica]TDD26537.1 hypothetical protein E1218_13050 [Kribbella turkmenica]